jgi:hypothetical protein
MENTMDIENKMKNEMETKMKNEMETKMENEMENKINLYKCHETIKFLFLMYKNGTHAKLIKKLIEIYYKKYQYKYPKLYLFYENYELKYNNLYPMRINSKYNIMINYDFMCNVLKLVSPNPNTNIYDKYDDKIRYTNPKLYNELFISQFGFINGFQC